MAKKKSFRKKSSRPTPPRGKKTTSSSKRRPAKRGKSAAPPRSDEQRLQRALASAGLGSRRDCEALIEEGRVEVDGKVVTQLGTKVNPRKQKIRVDGNPVKFSRLQYFAVNKPPGVVSTSSDPSGRMRVIDLIKTNERVYNVGRLDKSSEGLILVTNDGDLANYLTHPRYGVQKIYLVQVAGSPEVSELKKLQRGVYLAEGLAKVVGAKIKKRSKESTWLEITLEEGRNREIRRLLASIGHKVLRLRRVAIGTLRLGELPLGAHRRLEKHEVQGLWYSTARQKSSEKTSQHRRSKSPANKGQAAKRAEAGASEDSSLGGAKKQKTNPRGKSVKKSSTRSDSTSSSTKRKAKPKVGQKGWTPKSGGKRRKKKSTAVTRTQPARGSKRSVSKKTKRRK